MSLNEVKIRAKEIGVNNILTEEYDDFQGFLPWDDSNPQTALVPRRYTVANHVIDQSEVQANAGFTSSSFFSSVIDFKLDTTDISVVDHAFLAMSIQNLSGGAVVLPPTPFLFDRIELLAPNGNTLATIYDIDAWQAIMMLPRVDFENLAALMSTNSTYSTAGISIANNGTTELYLPLLTVWNAARLHLPGLKAGSYLTLRFRTKTSALGLVSGTAVGLNFTKCVVVLSGFDEPQKKRSMRTAFYRNQVTKFSNTPLYLPFYAWDHFTNALVLTASVQSSIKLSGLSGMFSALFVIVRALPLTSANQASYIALDNFNVQDESGMIFAGNQTKSHARSRIQIAAQMPNESGLNSNYYMVPFSSAVVNDFITGQVNGFQILKGNETLYLTPPAGLAGSGGNFQVDVIGLRAQAFRIQNGQIEKRQ